jgi:hypothetical protein
LIDNRFLFINIAQSIKNFTIIKIELYSMTFKIFPYPFKQIDVSYLASHLSAGIYSGRAFKCCRKRNKEDT